MSVGIGHWLRGPNSGATCEQLVQRGDRGGLAEWEETEGKKCGFKSTGLLMEGLDRRGAGGKPFID
jgi:hypothetical protein